MPRSFPASSGHAETPILRAAPAPMFLLSQAVSESGFKVVVTGEGADEVLAGYDVFREARVREFLARDPASPVRRRALELLYPVDGALPGQVAGHGRQLLRPGRSTPRTRRSPTAPAGSRPPL